MILIKSVDKKLEYVYRNDVKVATICTGVNIVFDVGELKSCKLYIDELETIDEKQLENKIKDILVSETLKF